LSRRKLRVLVYFM